MNFKDFLSTFDSYLQYENLFSSNYYGYVKNVFVEKKLLYPILIYHTDAMNHSILDNSITVLKFNFFVFDKLKTDNSNIIDVQDDLLKKLVKIQSYLKRKFFATNFNITAISDEAYSEKITGWVMDCLIKLDTSEATCIDMRERYLVDGISKYDRETYTIIECLLPSGSEAVFPNYTYFLDDYRNPVDKITLNIFQNIKFTGDFVMDNLKVVNDYEFTNSTFNGIFSCDKVKTIGIDAFRFSSFIGDFNCPELQIVRSDAFRNSSFNGMFNCPKVRTIDGWAFEKNYFIGSFNCPNLQEVGNSAFENSQFTGEFECPNLQTVGQYAFRRSNFTGDFDCPNLQAVGQYAFSYSQFNGNFNCPNLQAVGNEAFYYSQFTGVFNCQNLQAVGQYAFRNSNFTGEFNCPNLTSVGVSAFLKSNFSGSLSLPVCTQIGSYAFRDSNFTQITIGANATLGTNCIGAHSAEFINDYAANNKKAGTYVWDEVNQHWIYQN